MHKLTKPIRLLLLMFCCILIHVYSRDSIRVETGYSTGFYPGFSAGLRAFTGFLPFSLGDILYGLLIVWLLYRLFQKIRSFRKTTVNEPTNSNSGFWYRMAVRICFIYIVFNVLWGINYNRTGIADQLGIQVKDYSIAELEEVNCLLIGQINEARAEADRVNKPFKGNQELFRLVKQSYAAAENKYPFLDYRTPSLKMSIWGWLGNYTGFTGYYNPFSGEAQVNTTVPHFLQPFIGCHEVAHQLGYAKENEANFVGYLAAKESPDAQVRYSAYLDLFTYANRSLFALDSSSAKLYRRELSSSVQKDIEEWVRFNRSHRSPVEPLIRWAYGKYLEGNRQPKGIYSYDEVTAFLIAYYKKFNTI